MRSSRNLPVSRDLSRTSASRDPFTAPGEMPFYYTSSFRRTDDIQTANIGPADIGKGHYNPTGNGQGYSEPLEIGNDVRRGNAGYVDGLASVSSLPTDNVVLSGAFM